MLAFGERVGRVVLQESVYRPAARFEDTAASMG
jgi:hypothetical protein